MRMGGYQLNTYEVKKVSAAYAGGTKNENNKLISW
jgi:hypothetical protein